MEGQIFLLMSHTNTTGNVRIT